MRGQTRGSEDLLRGDGTGYCLAVAVILQLLLDNTLCLPQHPLNYMQQEENIRAASDPSVFTITEKAPTRAIMKKTFSCYYCLLPAFIKT